MTASADMIASTRSAGATPDRPRRFALTPALPAVSAWGAGLLLIALGAGALTAELTLLAGRAVGFLLATAGLAALVWGAISLATGRLVAVRLAVAAALASLIGVVAAFVIDPAGNSVFSVAAAILLLMIVAAWCAVAARHDAAARGGSGVVAIVLTAIAVAGVVTPALASTELARVSADSGGTITVIDRTGHDH